MAWRHSQQWSSEWVSCALVRVWCERIIGLHLAFCQVRVEASLHAHRVTVVPVLKVIQYGMHDARIIRLAMRLDWGCQTPGHSRTPINAVDHHSS